MHNGPRKDSDGLGLLYDGIVVEEIGGSLQRGIRVDGLPHPLSVPEDAGVESRHLGELVKSDGLLRRGGGLDVADKFKLTGSRQLYYHTVGKEAVDGRGEIKTTPSCRVVCNV